MKTKLLSFFLTLILISINSTCLALQFFTPDQIVKVIHTDNFNIYYQETQRNTAEKYAVIAEQVHNNLTQYMQWNPAGITDIVLTEISIPAGGIASILPRNRILLNGRLRMNDSDKERLFVHEYTHILHLDKAAGIHKWGRKILGRNSYFFPNVYQPRFLVEGLANYISNNRRFLNNPIQRDYSSNEMRVDLANKFKPLSQINIGYAMRSWPGAWNIYVYGDYFYQFLEQEYSHEMIQQFINNYSDNPLPFFANYNANQTFGKDLYELWDEFETYLHERFDREINDTVNSDFHSGVPLNSDTNLTTSYFTGDKQFVYFLKFSGKNRPGIYRYNESDQSTEHVISINGWAGLDYHQYNGLLITQWDYHEQKDWIADLYLVDTDNKTLQRLTYGADCFRAIWHPTEEKIIAVCQENDKSSIWSYTTKGEKIKELWRGENDLHFHQTNISPDGKSLLINTTQGDESFRVIEFNLLDGTKEYLTSKEYFTFGANYISNQEIVIALGDQTDNVNLVIYDKISKKYKQITNNLGVSHTAYYHKTSDSIFYNSYEHDGIQYYQLPLSVAKLQATNIPFNEPKSENKSISFASGFKNINSTTRDYSPFPFLKPTAWWPFISLGGDENKFGIRTYGITPLNWHRYFVSFKVDINEQIINWRFRYEYRRNKTKYKFSNVRYYSKNRDDTGKLNKIRSHTDFNFKMNRSWYNVSHQFTLGGLLNSSFHRDAKIHNINSQKSDTLDHRIATFLRFNNSRHFRDTISRINGIEASVALEQRFGKNFNGTDKAIQAEIAMFHQFYERNVLAAKIYSGISSRENDFMLGGVHGGDVGQYIKNMVCCFNGPWVNNVGLGVNKSFPLRGYLSGLPNLQGDKFYLVSAEWRFPLVFVERHYMRPPIGMRRLKGSVFVDHGAAWKNNKTAVTGVGSEIIFETSFFYLNHGDIKLGAAHGINNGGETQVYFRVGGSF